MTEASSNLPARLRLARERAGLSQGQAAKLLQLHRPTISEVEAGRRRVQAAELATFAKLYGTTTSWLLGEESAGGIDEDRIQLAARELTNLKREDFDKVIDLLTSLRDKSPPSNKVKR